MRRLVFVFLAVTTLAYLIVGSVVFYYLEDSSETSKKKSLARAHAEFIENNPHINTTELEELIMVAISTHSVGISVSAILQRNVTGSNFSQWENDDELQTSNWDIASGFLFCITVISTIGYGNMVPRTWGGQLFCIFYALFGIPIFGAVLVGTGERLQIPIKRLHKSRPWVKDNPIKDQKLKSSLLLTSGMCVLVFVPAWLFTLTEDWTFLDGMYYSVITLTTIGFGDLVPESVFEESAKGAAATRHYFYRIVLSLWIIMGLSWIALILSEISTIMQNYCPRARTLLPRYRFQSNCSWSFPYSQRSRTQTYRSNTSIHSRSRHRTLRPYRNQYTNHTLNRRVSNTTRFGHSLSRSRHSPTLLAGLASTLFLVPPFTLAPPHAGSLPPPSSIATPQQSQVNNVATTTQHRLSNLEELVRKKAKETRQRFSKREKVHVQANNMMVMGIAINANAFEDERSSNRGSTRRNSRRASSVGEDESIRATRSRSRRNSTRSSGSIKENQRSNSRKNSRDVINNVSVRNDTYRRTSSGDTNNDSMHRNSLHRKSSKSGPCETFGQNDNVASERSNYANIDTNVNENITRENHRGSVGLGNENVNFINSNRQRQPCSVGLPAVMS